MKKTVLVLLGCMVAVGLVVAADRTPVSSARSSAAVASGLPPSPLFDTLSSDADVVYLIANSSLVFGPDPKGRSEEVTFLGPVTVPKWPMKGYGRRILPDGRQQIDMELTQSELTGESYVLGGPVVLGEHPDLRSLGTITERPSETNGKDKDAKPEEATAPSEEVPADFVVERKVLLTTAKGILYNETAVPVRGRIDSIPPVKFQGTPTGVNVFRGMELPVALLDKDGNVNGWFYSKAHMAYATLPAAIERSFVKGTVHLRSGNRTESVEVSGPAEIHHLGKPATNGQTDMEVMMLALRGRSELLGGDIMLTETFSDRDHHSRGQLACGANSAFGLFVDVYSPSAKLTNREALPLSGQFTDCKVNGKLEKGKLSLPIVGAKGSFASSASRVLYDESEKATVELVKMQINIADNNH